VQYDKIEWSRDLELDLQRGNYAKFEAGKIRRAVYRPFCRRYLLFDRILNEEVYVNTVTFPTAATEGEDRIIITSDIAFRSPTFNTVIASNLEAIWLC